MRFLDRFRRRGGGTGPEFEDEELGFGEEISDEGISETSEDEVKAEEVSDEAFRDSDDFGLESPSGEISDGELEPDAPPGKGVSVGKIALFAVIALASLCVGYVAQPIINERLLGKAGTGGSENVKAEIERATTRISSLKRTLDSYQKLGTPEDLDLFITQGKAFVKNETPVERLTEERDLWQEKEAAYDDLLDRHSKLGTRYGRDRQAFTNMVDEIAKAEVRLNETVRQLADESIRYEALLKDLELLDNERLALEAIKRERFLQETQSFEKYLEGMTGGGGH